MKTVSQLSIRRNFHLKMTWMDSGQTAAFSGIVGGIIVLSLIPTLAALGVFASIALGIAAIGGTISTLVILAKYRNGAKVDAALNQSTADFEQYYEDNLRDKPTSADFERGFFFGARTQSEDGFNFNFDDFSQQSESERATAELRAEIENYLKENNPYNILGISHSASPREVRRALNKLALRFHPDKNSDSDESSKEKFREAYQAYVYLSDETKKGIVDQQLEYSAANNGPSEDPAADRHPSPRSPTPGKKGGIDDVD